ncbi:MAG: hypothetical protein UX09_C0013G0021 [Candidatus Uhrbacteria bacterium GW2011_GWE2_45_35]|uniref:Uncharacterized protein n=2 Tax=Candidatus Uhriibacteriota TaxID=1752732 RepID=A0A0G1JJX8_9BACT|nr:MAG: hypothetical protein UW63_C0005G0019 [Candidatus Uhrbacteria bacterium GW2011_GWF2_44_350]KKU08778.1 MAG: hypothetical protein UX09_C0013G0021 [Candidatus Uhrbacteria bacterium GW2011_GWE2_45_35]HBR80322.1 hypothetical protein [Candidatus Uhrbacteria bacterium]HCU31844.1 hypothetical protein [Candidatus Uhrbacteria bacterium]
MDNQIENRGGQDYQDWQAPKSSPGTERAFAVIDQKNLAARQAIEAENNQRAQEARDLAEAIAAEGTDFDANETEDFRDDLAGLQELLSEFERVGQAVANMSCTPEEKRWVSSRITENGGAEKAVIAWKKEITRLSDQIRHRDLVTATKQRKAA